MAEQRRQQQVAEIPDIDIGAVVVKTATSVVKNHPVKVSMWAVGCVLAAFANGFAVDPTTADSYQMQLSQANNVAGKELQDAIRNFKRADDKYYNSKGWFWSCDTRCQRAKDQMEMARGEVERVQQKMDRYVSDARKEVGIWSVYGVKDVRDSFWSAWESGKEFAARWTMMDAFFMMMPGSREESIVSVLVKLLFQYIVNLTMGLIGAFVYFVYAVYGLCVSYGESFASGLAFFLLVVVSGMSVVGTYLVAIYGTVAGGGYYLIKQAAKNAALEGERGQRPRRVQYGGGHPGMGRSHWD